MRALTLRRLEARDLDGTLRLSQAERRIEVLLRDNQGRPVVTPFDEKQATADRNEDENGF